MSNRIRWLLGLLVSAAALVAALWGINWGEALGALQRADFAFLALCTGTLLLQLLLRALRWQVLLGEGIGQLPSARCRPPAHITRDAEGRCCATYRDGSWV